MKAQVRGSRAHGDNDMDLCLHQMAVHQSHGLYTHSLADFPKPWCKSYSSNNSIEDVLPIECAGALTSSYLVERRKDSPDLHNKGDSP